MEALTIKTFKTSKISAAEVRENRSQDSKYKSVTFAYDGGEVPPIRVDGNFRVFKFENKNGPVHSLAIGTLSMTTPSTGRGRQFFQLISVAK